MKVICSLLFIFLWINSIAYAQSSDAQALTRMGNELSNQKNYPGAIDKYKAALAADTGYAPANYQLAYALNAAGKGMDAIAYLQKVFRSVTASTNIVAGAYDLAGGIYDQNHQPKKAIESYQAGIKANPAYQPLRYNLSLVYFRNKQYEDAEAIAEKAIKLDPKHVSSMRLYALVAFHQNKRAQALLGFCSFLILEPGTARSAEAYGNIQHILQGGNLKPEPGVIINPLTKNLAAVQNQVLTKALAGFATRRYASPADLLSAQLTSIFTALGAMPRDKYYYWYAIADYFGKLAQSPNMPAFARLVNLNAPDSIKWIKTHPQEMTDLDNWLKTTDRGF